VAAAGSSGNSTNSTGISTNSNSRTLTRRQVYDRERYQKRKQNKSLPANTAAATGAEDGCRSGGNS
jgi:hypothetical protein